MGASFGSLLVSFQEPIKPFMANGLVIWRVSCLQLFCLSSLIRQSCTFWMHSVKYCHLARLRSHAFSDAGPALCNNNTLKICMAAFSSLMLDYLFNPCQCFLLDVIYVILPRQLCLFKVHILSNIVSFPESFLKSVGLKIQ